MGEQYEEQPLVLKESLDSSATVSPKHSKLSYSKEFLLSLRDLESCRKHPSGLDSLVLRESRVSSFAEAIEGGIAVSTIPAKGLTSGGKNGDGNAEALREIPEWRRTPGNMGVSVVPQGSRRVEHGGGSFKPVTSYGENNHPRSNYDKSGWQGSGLARGNGRWEHRLGVLGKDGDHSHYDRDALEQDCGRRSPGTGSQAWQASIPPEHDGLLGSGSFLRSSRSFGGSIHLNIQGHDQRYAVGHVNHTTEPYLPPHSSQINHSRQDAKDSFNDETFGSDEISSQERSEHEKTRRESFELMRKEQQKVLQEKQKHIAWKCDEQCMSELSISSDKKHCDKNLTEDGQQTQVHAASLDLHAQPKSGAPIGVSLTSVAPTSSRPLVPPGFGKTFLEKQAHMKAANVEAILEVGVTGVEKNDPTAATVDAPLDGDRRNQVKEGVKGNQGKGGQSTMSSDDIGKEECKVVSQETSFASTYTGNLEVELLGSEISHFQTVGGLDTVSDRMKANKISSTPGTGHDNWSVGLDDVLNSKKAGQFEIESKGIKERQVSILDKLFGKDLAEVDGGDASGLIESHIVNGGDETWTQENSKFARWFHKEEYKPKAGMSSLGASDILSLLANSEKASPPTSSVSEERAAVMDAQNGPLNSVVSFRNPGRVLPMPHGPLLEDVEKVMTSDANGNIHGNVNQLKSSGNHSSDSLGLEIKVDLHPNNCSNGKDYQDSVLKLQQVVLTCEDLEQSILAEANESVQQLQLPLEEIQNDSAENSLTGEQKLCIDNHASQHLLSLLHKGSSLKEQYQSVIQSLDYQHLSSSKVFGETAFGSCLTRHNAKEVESCEKTGTMQTLEVLFGKAFMKELHSVEAPVSVKTVSNDRTYSGKSDGLESPSDVLSMNRQNPSPLANFETGTCKSSSFPASTKASNNEVEIKSLQMHQSSSAVTASVPGQESTSLTSDLSRGIWRSFSDLGSENAKVIGGGNVHCFRAGAEAMPNTVENRVYLSNLASDFGNEGLRVTSGFQIVEDSIIGGLFESSIKEHHSDGGGMQHRHSSMGQDDSSVGVELPAEESLIDVGNLKTSESSKFMPFLPIIEATDMCSRSLCDDFLSSEIKGATPEMVQKLATLEILEEDYLKDGKQRQKNHGIGVHVMNNQYYWDVELPDTESKTLLNEMMRGNLRDSHAASAVADSIPLPSLSYTNSGVQQLFGLSSSQSSSFSLQQLQMPTDLPFKSHTLPGQHTRPPSPFSPYHYREHPHDLNSGGFNVRTHQQLNPHQSFMKNQQINYINCDSSLERPILGFGHSSDPLFGRFSSQEPSRHMTHPFQNAGSMSHSAYQPILPPGHAQKNFVHMVQMPQRGGTFPSLNNVPLFPERLPHCPSDVSSNQVPQVPGVFILDNSSLQGAPFHHQPIPNTLGQSSTNLQHQSLRSDVDTTSGFIAPVGPGFHGGMYVGAVGDSGTMVDRWFDMKPRTTFGGTLSATQYPLPTYRLESDRNSGYR